MFSKPLSEIKPRQSPQLISIRVLKKWISRGKRDELRYMFVDFQANAIEVIADLKDEQHFDSIINIHSCYNITNYISIASRKHMSITPHEASIIIGKKTKFVPISNDNIPTTYFNFARYEELQGRLRSCHVLTG